MKNTSVTLGDHFDHFVAEALANGRYRSASEIIREGLRLLEDRETKLAALRAALLKGEQSGFVNFSLEELNRELDATLGS
jgi:antitoxin ParD1/3/4